MTEMNHFYVTQTEIIWETSHLSSWRWFQVTLYDLLTRLSTFKPNGRRSDKNEDFLKPVAAKDSVNRNRAKVTAETPQTHHLQVTFSQTVKIKAAEL